MIVKLSDASNVSKLFEGWQESCIWTCLEGIMGEVYCTEDMYSAKAVLGDFSYLAGKPNRELIEYNSEYGIIVPQNEEWAALIESVYGNKVKRSTRYATKKENGVFDKKHLQKAAKTIPDGYELKMIDRDLYVSCKQNEWSKDFVSHYPTYEEFESSAIGVVALYNGEIAAGASSYSHYSKGIEIEIVTDTKHRRRGLAYACGAKLVLACLDRGLLPCWDAKTKISLAIAQKLGFNFSHEYPAYIYGEPENPNV